MAKKNTKTKSKKSNKKKNSKKSQSSNILKNLTLVSLTILLFGLIFFLSNNPTIKKKKIPKNTPGIKKVVNDENETSVIDAILYAAKQLNIPDSYYATRTKDDGIHIRLPINRAAMDLNFANMIISGQVEMAGGEILSGEESRYSDYQVLKYYDPSDENIYHIKIYYDKKNEYPEEKTKIAIIVDDFGNTNDALVNEFCELDSFVTFAILPDLPYARDVMTKAIATGHETIIHMPMEPMNYPKNDPGKNAIFVELTEKQITQRVSSYIKTLPGCIGANNHMGSLATSDEKVMNTVLDVLKKNELFFIDSRTTSSSVAYEIAQKKLLPSDKRDIFLDSPKPSDEALSNAIKKINKLKKEQNSIVVITHCLDRKRLNQLKEFIQKAEIMGFDLVPASKLFENNLPEIL